MKHSHTAKSAGAITESRGFTLVELMITMVISGIIVAAIYAAYILQQRTYTAQDQVAEMQQNIRAAMMIVNKEVRMAGYDHGNGTNDASCNVGATGSPVVPGVLSAAAGQLDFSMDLNSNGDCADPGENLSYYIYTLDGIQKLGRLDNNNPPVQAVANNIDQIEFNYLDSSDIATTQPDNARSIQISLLARTGKADRKFKNTAVYTSASGVSWGPYGDNFRRRFLTTKIKCRNLGI